MTPEQEQDFYEKSISPHTRKAYLRVLREFFRTVQGLSPQEITPRHVLAWRELLGTAQVLTGEHVGKKYTNDTTGQERQIPVVLRILDSSVLPEVMRIALAHATPGVPHQHGPQLGLWQCTAGTGRLRGDRLVGTAKGVAL